MTGHPPIRQKRLWPALFIAAGLALALALALTGAVRAETIPASGQPAQMDSSTCLGCHQNPGQSAPLASGETIPTQIDPTLWDKSVHGAADMQCTVCHVNINAFPHPAVEVATAREYSLSRGETCKTCHADKYEQTADSMHTQALKAGDNNAPVCADCHNPHTQAKITDGSGKILPEQRVNVPSVCARCHAAIYDKYKQSVHGAALEGEGNPDVPTCVDCHGTHNIGDPTTAQFRLSSPQLCGKCHTDASIMDKYGLSTQVLRTYVSDFHGTTVTLFQKQSPDQLVNMPVCYDCHGIHDIAATDDPVKGLQMKQNMLAACQRCHPDASDNFPTSWLSHYIPSRTKAPLVYWVTLFYTIFIPLVLGGMALFILTDIYRRIRTRGKHQSQHDAGSKGAAS